MKAIRGTASDPSVIEEIDDLYAYCGIVEDSINRALVANRDFFHLTLAIEEMETVIQRAIAGESPDMLAGARSVPMNSCGSCRTSRVGR
jgi:hypothetical protein